ncbi:MAG: hypothetical protein WC933_02030 [Candidatus Paceibacterota bacterium]|jgi:hypothetical protein
MSIINTNELKDSIKKIGIIDWIKFALIAIVLIAGSFYIFQKADVKKVDTSNNVATTTTKTTPKTTTTVKTQPAVLKNVTSKCNFKVVSPVMYAKVSMPFTVSGILDKSDTTKGCMWGETTSLAGNAEIFYNKNGTGWVSAGSPVSILTKGTPGMPSSYLSFSVSFNLYVTALGLQSGTPIKIVFTEFNIPVKPNPDTFDFLVSLK